MSFHLTIKEAKEALAKVSEPFVSLLQDRQMRVEYFAPQGKDTQTPHEQAELYIIASGKSEFVRETEIVDCKTGDVLFVPEGMDHYFQNFSDDFATWVIFY